MKRLLVTALLCLPLPAAAGEQETIQPGDWLFVKARPLECEFGKRLVDAAEVSESGEVLLLDDLTVQVVGKAPAEAAELLTDGVEQRDGYRPQTIEILRIDRSDTRRLTVFLMVMASEQDGRCQQTPEKVLPEWKPGYRVAQVRMAIEPGPARHA